MEDTLRYFYSSVFQGFAALITLGAMYYLYFFDKTDSQKKDLIEKLKSHGDYANYENRDYIIKYGIITYLEEKLLPLKKDIPQYDTVRFIVESYKKLQTAESQIKNYLPILLKKSITVLITSLICLFLIGYNLYLDYVLMVAGVIVIILSIDLLLSIKKLILVIICGYDYSLLKKSNNA